MLNTSLHCSRNNFTFLCVMWLIIFSFVCILTIAYSLLIFAYNIWFRDLHNFKLDKDLLPATHFSIIIPARNEEQNIEKCVNSILQNEYPQNMYEIIIVNDFSTDTTTAVVEKLQTQFNHIRLLHLHHFVKDKINSYKKKSIETAIAHSTLEWIVTTDADCEVNAQWLQTFDNFIQKNDPVFVSAPVKFINNNSFLSVFQCLDFMSLQGITAASVSAGVHSMCNGANIAYRKDTFHMVNGFKDVDSIASGDDMLLMHKIKQHYPNKIGYLFSKKAIVNTLPMETFKSFIHQRIRWASKATSYSDKKIFFVLLLVYLFNFCLFIVPFICIFIPQLFFYWLILVIVKIFSELVFMFPVAKFFGEKKLLWWFPVMQPFHIIYTVVAGWLGKFGKYEWKGRNVK